MKIVTLFLTCAHHDEANTIAKNLLEKRLIACAKQMPITSLFHWHKNIEGSHEILMIMDTISTKFKAIETEVRKLHSYEMFVLIAFEAIHVSSAAKQWILDEVQ